MGIGNFVGNKGQPRLVAVPMKCEITTADATSLSPSIDSVNKDVHRPYTILISNRVNYFPSEILRKRSAFRITDKEETLIAAPAIIGLRRMPKKG